MMQKFQMPFFPYAKPSLSDEDRHEVMNALSSDVITRGPYVEKFENAVADYCKVNYAVAFSNASNALTAAFRVVDTNQNDRILTTPNTYVSTISGGCLAGATPVFIDIDPQTGNLDLEKLSHNFNTKSTRGRPIIVPVHFGGIPVDMKQLDGLINNPDAIVIEDASHVIGAHYPDQQKVGCCSYSQMTIFSFHPAKTMTTGEGGMVLTNSEELYHRLKKIRNNGIEREARFLENKPAPWYYEVQELSSNYNFTDFQAALGLSQLQRLDSFVKKRRELIGVYRELLADIKHLRMFTNAHDYEASFHLCVVQINFEAYRTTRTEVMNKLFDAGIGTQVHYIPLYRHPYFKKLCGNIDNYFPCTEAYYSQALSLPLYPELEIQDIEYIILTLQNILRKQ